MKNKLLIILSAIGITFGSFLYALAAPNTTYQVNLLPQANDTYDLGTTTPAYEWNNLYVKNVKITGTCTGCGSSSFVATSSLAATYPVQIATSPSAITYSLAFGTTTSNTWAGTQTFTNASTSQLTATSSVYLATLGGNIGIGTTTPNWLLQAAGTRPSFALSDTSAGANLKHWLFSSMGGNLYIGTSTDAYATSTPAALSISNAGNLSVGGAGTTTLAGFLDVNGTGANATSTFVSNLWVKGTLRTGTGSMYLNDNGLTSSDGNIALSRTSTSTLGTNGLAIGASQFVLQQGSGNVGIGTTSPWGLLSVNPNGITGPALVVGSSTATNFIVTNGGNVGIASTSPTFPFSVNNSGSDFYISSTGELVGRDTTNAWSGRVSPTHSFVLSTATTTTWTASTTGSGYSPFITMPFAGTLRQVRCTLDQSFLGVNVQVNGSNATPSYFVASTTVGTIAFTAGNTFSVGQKILANFGTTTTATTLGASCTFDVTETP